MQNFLVKISSEQSTFLDNVRFAMEQYFGDDRRRIDHALQVTHYARQLLAYIDADPVVTLTASYLHDIGIPEAQRKYGSSAGNWQEIEGPPVARALLSELDVNDELIELVVAIIGGHHTSGAIESPEFRIVWDADALVNFAEVLSDKNDDQIKQVLRGHMATEPGFRIGCKLFMKDSECHKLCLTGHRPAILP